MFQTTIITLLALYIYSIIFNQHYILSLILLALFSYHTLIFSFLLFTMSFFSFTATFIVKITNNLLPQYHELSNNPSIIIFFICISHRKNNIVTIITILLTNNLIIILIGSFSILLIAVFIVC